MFRIQNVRAYDFRSFEYLDFSPDQGSVTFIFGRNEDEQESESNGAGKSSIVKSIAWCLTGETDTGLSSKDFIRNGCDESQVVLTMRSDSLDETIVLTRSVGRKSSMKLSANLNSEELGYLFDTAEVENWLYSKIGISKQDIKSYYVIDQSNPHSFLSATDSTKKAIISRISGFSFLDDVVANLKSVKKKQDARLVSLRNEANRLSAYRDAAQDTISRLSTHRPKIDLRALGRDLSALEKDLAQIELTPEPPRPSESDLIRVKADLRNTESSLFSLNRKISDCDSRLSTLKQQLTKNELVCVSCDHVNFLDQEFQSKTSAEIKSIESDKKRYEGEIPTQKVIAKLSDAVTKETQKFDSEMASYRKSIEQISESRRLIDALKSRISEKKSEISSGDIINQSIESDFELMASMTAQRNDAESGLEKIERDIEKIETRLSNLSFWIKSFSAGGSFRSFLARKTLRAIEFYINETLDKFDVGMNVNISGFTEKSSGGYSDKINITVSNNRGGTRPFASLSGGQKARLNICSVLAIIDFFNSSSGVEGLDFLVLDEFLDNMDVLGIRAAEKVLVDSGVTSIIVSHVVDTPAHAKSIAVVLRNGVSTISV